MVVLRRALSLADTLGPATLVAALVLAIWIALAWRDGGIPETTRGPLGIGLVLLVAIATLLVPAPPGYRSGARLAMLVSAAAFVAWSFLSIVWAGVPDTAWTGANVTLIYGTCFAAFALWPWAPSALTALLGGFSLSTTSIGAIVLARAAASADPSAWIEESRLVGTIGYTNADVALWTMALLPAVYLAGRRDLPPPVRALFLTAGTLLLALAVLGQSRAWLFLLPVTVALFVLLARQRLRTILGLAVVGCSTLAIVGPLLDVFQTADAGRPVGPALSRAAWFILGACLVAGVAGFVWAAFDRRVGVSARTSRALGIAVVVLCLAGLGAGAAAAVVRVDDPRAWIEQRWDDFTRGYAVGESESRFTGSLGTGRYLIWKVAWREFLDHPLVGIGADNFAVPYLERRTNNFSEPIHPHSTPLRLLSQLGIVGTALATAAAGIAVALALRRRRHLDAAGGGAVGVALAVFGYWLVHGSVDVLWETPAVAAPALGMLAMAASTELEVPRARGPAPIAAGRRRAKVAVGVGVGLVACVASLSLLFPTLSYTYTRSAVGLWSVDPQLAQDRFRLAARFDPLTAEPYLVEGSLALESGDMEIARRSLRQAAEREPENWYVYMQLALLEGSIGDYAAAGRAIARVRDLNPRDSLAKIAERLIDARAPIHPMLFDRLFAEELNRQSVAYLVDRYFQVPPFVEP